VQVAALLIAMQSMSHPRHSLRAWNSRVGGAAHSLPDHNARTTAPRFCLYLS
jgi:hypothetical protein